MPIRKEDDQDETYPTSEERVAAFRSIAERAIKEAVARGEIQIEHAD